MSLPIGCPARSDPFLSCMRSLAAIAACATLVGGVSEAALPDVIDLADGADATVTGAETGDYLSFTFGPTMQIGGPLATGDFNGDGTEDILVGAPQADGPVPRSLAGEAYVLFGATGLSGDYDLGLDPWDVKILGADGVDFGHADRLGSAVAAGDVNGDGYDDLILSAPRAWGPGETRSDAGEVYVVLGASDLAGVVDIANGDQDLTVLGDDSGDRAGSALACGDFNNDGYDDILIGAPFADGRNNDVPTSGEAYVILGSDQPSGTLDLSSQLPSVIVYPPGAGSGKLGATAAGGDLNGDGCDDVILGAPSVPALQATQVVILGSTSPSPVVDLSHVPAELEVWNARSTSLATGDLNGDEYEDLVIGRGYDNLVHVILGSETLPGSIDVSLGQENLVIHPVEYLDSCGLAVATGDLDHDGFDDILIGAETAGGPDNARGIAGEAYVVYGAGDLPPSIDLGSDGSDVTIWGAWGYSEYDPVEDVWEHSGDQFGGAVASGDVNGDLADDFLGGAPNAMSTRGRVYVLFGGPYIDLDSDGYHDGIDCDDTDGQVWKIPGDVDGLTLFHDHDTSTTVLTWPEPIEPGGVSPRYDVLRSDLPSVFFGAICLESDDGTDRTATDTETAEPGLAFHYLVRAGTSCGEGTLGQDTDGWEREGSTCP